MSKEDRIEIVNNLLKVVASTGRNFFLNKRADGDVAYIFYKNKRLYMFNEYSKVNMCINTKNDYQPKGWSHGSGLWYFTLALKRFIITGIKPVEVNCSYWGYNDDEVEFIQSEAKRLKYLRDD
jgi:hypothetical protein